MHQVTEPQNGSAQKAWCAKTVKAPGTGTSIPDIAHGIPLTIPLPRKRGHQTTQLKQPSQQAAGGGQQSGGGKYVDKVAKTVDLVIDRILQTQTKDNSSQGMGDNTPCAPLIQDASKWSEDQKREFMQFQQDKAQFQQADRVRLTKFQAGAMNNQQDTIKHPGKSKATFYGKMEPEKEKENASPLEIEPSKEEAMDRIIEAARLQEA